MHFVHDITKSLKQWSFCKIPDDVRREGCCPGSQATIIHFGPRVPLCFHVEYADFGTYIGTLIVDLIINDGQHYQFYDCPSIRILLSFESMSNAIERLQFVETSKAFG